MCLSASASQSGHGTASRRNHVIPHAYAEFQADASGRIDVDHTAPIKGTYTGVDPLGARAESIRFAHLPSSVVWSGFGRDPMPGEVYSSWSVQGHSLPFIPYDNYSDVLQGRLSAAAVHRRSLEKASPTDRAAARIPV
jgi:hypothetical protein